MEVIINKSLLSAIEAHQKALMMLKSGAPKEQLAAALTKLGIDLPTNQIGETLRSDQSSSVSEANLSEETTKDHQSTNLSPSPVKKISEHSSPAPATKLTPDSKPGTAGSSSSEILAAGCNFAKAHGGGSTSTAASKEKIREAPPLHAPSAGISAAGAKLVADKAALEEGKEHSAPKSEENLEKADFFTTWGKPQGRETAGKNIFSPTVNTN